MSKPEIADPVYANKANLAATVLASGISSGDTTISVVSASMLPTASFYATIAPAGGMSDTQNSEIVLVTAISGNTLTVERAQRGTTAKSFEAGAVIFNGVYVHDVAYDASELFDTTTNVYPDPSGLAQAIVDGRPLVVRSGGNTDGIWNMVNVVSATIDNYSGSEQMPTATIVYVSDDRLVTAVVNLSSGAITRSGATIATNGNKVLSGANILANSITSDNIDFTTLTSAQLAEVTGGWVLLGESNPSGTVKSASVTWTTPYRDLKFVASAQSVTAGDVYVSPTTSSGGSIAMSGGTMMGFSSNAVVAAHSEAWNNNLIVVDNTEAGMGYNIQGQSIRNSTSQWRVWQVWGAQSGNLQRSIQWIGRQNSNTETMGLRWNSNGTFSGVYLAVWGRRPY